MNEGLLALVISALGLAIAGYGILKSVRTRPHLRTERVARIQDRIDTVMEMRAQTFDPEQLATLDRFLVRYRALQAEAEMSAKATMEASATVEQGSAGTDQRTVELQGQDGSRVTLTVDPDDAASVHDFLNGARRLGGERVIAVS